MVSTRREGWMACVGERMLSGPIVEVSWHGIAMLRVQQPVFLYSCGRGLMKKSREYRKICNEPT